MAPCVRPVSVLVNVPAPDPTVTLNVDEPVVVPYTKPLALTSVDPSSVTLPPKIALEDVILVAEVVAANIGVLDIDGTIVVVLTALTNKFQAFVSTFKTPALKFQEYAGMKLAA